ncbi:hypothetical protein GGI21_002316 [Coemansia aciculifera]|uniref:Uncharacterized protein n=1 Tax=Coemansia aciculifera TaxID=417176 RepID=A0ACC1M5S7_9FUNG|nr:hypothetical protein IWW38_001642 [Coemansia aciculifera]KAJ2909003.1 hypothetical protein GGI21_002316 [Coemansia aciculifera]
MRLVTVCAVLLGMLAHSVLCIFYIPTTTIDNTASFYSEASLEWTEMRDQVNGLISKYSADKNYGVYVLMTSIYGPAVPTVYDDKYLHSLMSDLQHLGATTWDDAQLESISSTYQQAHQTWIAINAAPPSLSEMRLGISATLSMILVVLALL